MERYNETEINKLIERVNNLRAQKFTFNKINETIYNEGFRNTKNKRIGMASLKYLFEKYSKTKKTKKTTKKTTKNTTTNNTDTNAAFIVASNILNAENLTESQKTKFASWFLKGVINGTSNY